MPLTPELLVDDLYFPEGPRWRQGPNPKLWFSDILAARIMTVDLAGNVEIVADVPESPSGLGWWPDGRLVAVSVNDGKLMSVGADGTVTEVADMHALNGQSCNDMVVDASGRAYIGSFGDGLDEDKLPGPGNMPAFSNIILVEPDADGQGRARIVADRMTFPNGPVITPDGKTYIVAETFANRLTAFDIADDGSLTNRRVWADIGAPPDGICLDEEGCLWVAVPYYAYGGSGGCIRIREGGEVLDRIDVEGYASFACTLGGPDMKTLFLCESTILGHERHPWDGRIRVTSVDVPGTGTP